MPNNKPNPNQITSHCQLQVFQSLMVPSSDPEASLPAQAVMEFTASLWSSKDRTRLHVSVFHTFSIKIGPVPSRSAQLFLVGCLWFWGPTRPDLTQLQASCVPHLLIKNHHHLRTCRHVSPHYCCLVSWIYVHAAARSFS